MDSFCSCINKACECIRGWAIEGKYSLKTLVQAGQEVMWLPTEKPIKKSIRKATEMGLLGGINVGNDVANCYNHFFSGSHHGYCFFFPQLQSMEHWHWTSAVSPNKPRFLAKSSEKHFKCSQKAHNWKVYFFPLKSQNFGRVWPLILSGWDLHICDKFL